MYPIKWYYLGHYRIVQEFQMSPVQWANIPERVKAQKTRPYMTKRAARKWCLANNVEEKDFRQAVDEGRWKFDVLVIECIYFDQELYNTLKPTEIATI